MARELQLARRETIAEAVSLESATPWGTSPVHEAQNSSTCQHRTVAKDGRIVCSRIVEGDNEVTPNVCRDCPFKSVACGHLRFTLRQTSPSPLIVRYNGRTEIWDDGQRQLTFERAACAAKVVPVYDPRSCAGCTLRQPVQAPINAPSRRPAAAALGRVVAFPGHEPMAAAG